MLTEQLATVRSRGEIKALGRVLDKNPDARDAAERLAAARGIGAVEEMNGKRLVRALLGREASAQVRTNPIHRDEAFVCLNCQEAVPRGGAQVRRR